MIALLDGAQGYAVPSNSGKDRRPARSGAKPLTAAQDKAASATSRVRIIGGQWRSRRIRFEAAPEVRPTPDRIRETLFNWLQADVPGARCLDLFAGSGALGLEAASRGAREVTLVERDRRVVKTLEATIAELGASGVRVVEADAFAFLNGPAPSTPYDLVFLDPPFAKGWLAELCTLLERRGWLAPNASIYLECAVGDGEPSLPTGWTLRRSARAGEVGAHLAQRRPEPASPSIDHSGIEPSGIEQR
jgi:16S rRNA (guanine966-N2)-methyltransferase